MPWPRIDADKAIPCVEGKASLILPTPTAGRDESLAASTASRPRRYDFRLTVCGDLRRDLLVQRLRIASQNLRHAGTKAMRRLQGREDLVPISAAHFRRNAGALSAAPFFCATAEAVTRLCETPFSAVEV